MPRFRTSQSSGPERYKGRHRFEHWYRDNSIYFITARCRDRFPAFAAEQAKDIFWDRFTYWTQKYQFVPIVASLLDNHYHLLGYLAVGQNLGPMMQKLHGSVAKKVNDLLEPRRPAFWRDVAHKNYFDGCIRDVLQFRRAYQYTRGQSVRHGICRRWEEYPHTRVGVQMEPAIRRAVELRAFLEGVPYARSERGRRSGG